MLYGAARINASGVILNLRRDAIYYTVILIVSTYRGLRKGHTNAPTLNMVMSEIRSCNRLTWPCAKA